MKVYESKILLSLSSICLPFSQVLVARSHNIWLCNRPHLRIISSKIIETEFLTKSGLSRSLTFSALVRATHMSLLCCAALLNLASALSKKETLFSSDYNITARRAVFIG